VAKKRKTRFCLSTRLGQLKHRACTAMCESDFVTAAVLLREVSLRAPRRTKVLIDLATCQENLGDLMGAQESLKRSLKIQPLDRSTRQALDKITQMVQKRSSATV
jgi:hypothetical protein